LLYFAEKLSPHIAESAEGYLICRGVPVARSGTQYYMPEELQMKGLGLSTAGGGNFDRAFLARNKRSARWAVAPIEGADRSSNLLQPTASDRNFIVGNPPASYHPFKKTCRDFIPGRQNDPMLFLAFYLSAVQAYRPALRVFGFAFLTGPG
jgi:hypothetical protein